MKNIAKTLVAIITLITVTSCKSDEEKKVELLTDKYVKSIDSLSSIAKDEANANWNDIESYYQIKSNELKTELDKVKDKVAFEERYKNSIAKYESFKKDVIENAALQKRKALFGNDYIGDDMKFEWVNKDNILSIYDQFVNTVQKNKDFYSREDWDEIKLLYEALDSRKNTIEKQGLSSSDNLKIAGLKIKFAPMYTLNRMGAKSEENAEAKK